MNKKYLIGLAIILVIIILAIGIVWYKHSSDARHSSYTVLVNRVLPKQTSVTLTTSGFTPEKITIKKGTSVRWINKSGKQGTVNSDNYPTNQLHKELNFGIFSNNSSVVYTFMKPGTYGYHNQLNPKQTGKVVVEN